MDGPVQKAFRATFRTPAWRRTFGRGVDFALNRMEDDAVELLLGLGENSTWFPWEGLETVPDYLRGEGWVPVGGLNSVKGEPGTLDWHLKQHSQTNVARWLAVLLVEAGVVDADSGRPLRVRLRGSFGRATAESRD